MKLNDEQVEQVGTQTGLKPTTPTRSQVVVELAPIAA
jgi:hypothetical protein